VLGDDFQPAVEAAAAGAAAQRWSRSTSRAGTFRADDPHVWLDPARMSEIVDAVASRLARATPSTRVVSRPRDRYNAVLQTLEREYSDGLAGCSRRPPRDESRRVWLLADAFDLDQRSVSGLSPDAEPDAARSASSPTSRATRRHDRVLRDAGLAAVARTVAREAGSARRDAQTAREPERG
jgi:zinc transport system substrate-binding protein